MSNVFGFGKKFRHLISCTLWSLHTMESINKHQLNLKRTPNEWKIGRLKWMAVTAIDDDVTSDERIHKWFVLFIFIRNNIFVPHSIIFEIKNQIFCHFRWRGCFGTCFAFHAVNKFWDNHYQIVERRKHVIGVVMQHCWLYRKRLAVVDRRNKKRRLPDFRRMNMCSDVSAYGIDPMFK